MASSSDQVVQAVMAQIANRSAAGPEAPPLTIMGKEELKPTSLVVYGASGKQLNFSPEELQEPPESFEGNERAQKEWRKIVPVYTRKGVSNPHFSAMSLEQLRVAMERAVLKSLAREKEDRKKKSRRRNQLKAQAKTSECLLLRNMVGPGELDDEIKDDIIMEMVNFGNVLLADAIEVDNPPSEEEAVRIFIRFEKKEEAIRAKEAMHLRVFDGRYIACSYFPLERFLAKDFAPNSQEDKLPEKCKTRFTIEDQQRLEAEARAKAEAASSAAPGQPGSEAAKPGEPDMPAMLLPAHTQALIDVVLAAAAHEEITDDMIDAADPITALQRRAKRKVVEDAAAAAAADQDIAAAKKDAAAAIAAKLNAQIEAKRRRVETVTEDVDGLD